MEKTELKPILEALIFASEEPLGLAALVGVLEEQGVGKSEIKETLQEMMQTYQEDTARGFFLREVDGAYQFVTKPAWSAILNKLNLAKPKTLSQASLETLAIIAYRQPVVRSELEQIRGVDSGGVLKTLLERGYIKIVGRREEAGQPLIYGTTPAFLELFHLTNLAELPSMKEIEQIVEESQKTKTESPEVATEENAVAEEGLDESQSAVFYGELPGDDEALGALESSLKDLRKLEKEIFSEEKKVQEGEATIEEVTNLTQETTAESE